MPDNNEEKNLNEGQDSISLEKADEVIEQEQNFVSLEKPNDSVEEVIEVEETSEEETDENQATESEEYTSQFGELEGFVENYNPENAGQTLEKQKKPVNKKKLAIILGVVVVLLAVIAVAVYFVFFNNSPKGVWVLNETSEDGSTAQQVYYKFNDGSLETVVGNDYMTQTTVYSKVNYGNNAFSIVGGDTDDYIQNFSYTMSGNLIQGKTMEFSFDKYPDEKTSIVKVDNVGVPTELKGPKFKLNKDIVGVWKNTAKSGYLEYLVFDENGYLTEKSVDSKYYNAERTQRYNYDKSQLTMSSEGEDYNVPAEIRKGKLYITSTNMYTGEAYEIEYEKVSDSDYKKFKEELSACSVEIPTDDLVVHSSQTEDETGTEESSKASTTEAVTEGVSK